MTLGAGFQLARRTGYLDPSSPMHAWVVASFFLVGLAVIFELRKPEPDGALIGRLMRRFVYTSGITG